MATNPVAAPPPSAFAFTYDQTAFALLREHGFSIACTTYQAGKIALLRAGPGRISALLRSFDWASGLAIRPGSMALGTRREVWLLRNEPGIAGALPPTGTHDACWVPRQSHVTGDIRIHDLAWGAPATGAAEPQLWFVNTRFSCLCTLDPRYSFVPRWQPPFVSAVAAEDRCHLNGLAIRDGQPRYVTALGETDTPDGWRPGKATGGVILDVATGEVICRGLAMPHSPRWHRGRLFVLNSGYGDLEVVDLDTGNRDIVARLPGYTRGLAFHGDCAFVGLSKVREKHDFGGLPVEKLGDQIRCGIWIVDLTTGRLEGFVEFTGGIEEIFAVEVLPGMRFPALVGLEKDTISGIYIVPIDDDATGHGGSAGPRPRSDEGSSELLAEDVLRATAESRVAKRKNDEER